MTKLCVPKDGPKWLCVILSQLMAILATFFGNTAPNLFCLVSSVKIDSDTKLKANRS